MGSPFEVGKKAFGFCDRCGFRYLLVDLRVEVVDLQNTSIRVCPECFDPDQPQLQLGRYVFNDPQALRNPRPDIAQSAVSRSGMTLRRTRITSSRRAAVLAGRQTSPLG